MRAFLSHLAWVGLIAAIPAVAIANAQGPDRCSRHMDLTWEGRPVLTEHCVGRLGLALFEDRIVARY